MNEKEQNLISDPGDIFMTIQIIRAKTGKIEEFNLIGKSAGENDKPEEKGDNL